MSADLIARGLAARARSDAATAQNAATNSQTSATNAQSTANAALAGAAAKTPNTAALIAAIRTNGFFPQPLATTTIENPNNIPTGTLGAANSASALNGRSYANPLLLLSDSRFKWLAGPTSIDNGCWLARGAYYGGSRASQYSAFEFVHTGTSFELSICNGGFYSPANAIRILVNDQIVRLINLPTSDGNFYYAPQIFPTSATRRIRIEGAAGKWVGVNVVASGEITATGRTYPLITVMGDSFAEGTGSAFYQDGEAVSLVRALGGNVALGGVGGTGLLNPGNGGLVAWTDATRMTDLTMAGVTDVLGGSTAPSLGIVMASINDQGAAQSLWGGAANFQEAIYNAARKIIQAWIAANPGKPLVWFGPTWTNDSPVLDIYRIRDGVQQACWGVANVWFIDRLGPGPLLRLGAANFLSTTGNTTNGSAVITAIPSTTGIVGEAGIEGPGIPAGAKVVSIDSGTQVTLGQNATATAAGAALVFRNTHTQLYGFGPADGTHPGQAGHNLDALWMARELRNLILTHFA